MTTLLIYTIVRLWCAVSGAGKSTLLNVLTGTIAPSCGHVTLNGAPVDRRWRRKMAYVMQNDAFYADLTLRETLTVPYVINALLLLPSVTLLYRHLLSLLQAQNLSFHSRDQTGLTMLLDLFLVRIFVNFSVCSVWWIHVSFLLHVKYTISCRIVFCIIKRLTLR